MTDIPTNTEALGSVRMPKDWNFSTESGRIKIVDSEGNAIATELYSEWIYESYGNYLDESEVDFNSDLPKAYRNMNNYELVKGCSHPAYLYTITVGSSSQYALKFEIMDKESINGSYYLFLVFDSSINDIKLFSVMQNSYRWGGYIFE